MTGFKNFILRGNLIELAVAFVMAAAFATVVNATVNIILSIVGKVGGRPDFSAIAPGGIPIGAWITAVVSFVIISAVVYFVVVKPYTEAKERFFPDDPAGTPADVALLEEIRDLLKAQAGPGGTPGSSSSL